MKPVKGDHKVVAARASAEKQQILPGGQRVRRGSPSNSGASRTPSPSQSHALTPQVGGAGPGRRSPSSAKGGKAKAETKRRGMIQGRGAKSPSPGHAKHKGQGSGLGKDKDKDKGKATGSTGSGSGKEVNLDEFFLRESLNNVVLNDMETDDLYEELKEIQSHLQNRVQHQYEIAALSEVVAGEVNAHILGKIVSPSDGMTGTPVAVDCGSGKEMQLIEVQGEDKGAKLAPDGPAANVAVPVPQKAVLSQMVLRNHEGEGEGEGVDTNHDSMALEASPTPTMVAQHFSPSTPMDVCDGADTAGGETPPAATGQAAAAAAAASVLGPFAISDQEPSLLPGMTDTHSELEQIEKMEAILKQRKQLLLGGVDSPQAGSGRTGGQRQQCRGMASSKEADLPPRPPSTAGRGTAPGRGSGTGEGSRDSLACIVQLEKSLEVQHRRLMQQWSRTNESGSGEVEPRAGPGGRSVGQVSRDYVSLRHSGARVPDYKMFNSSYADLLDGRLPSKGTGKDLSLASSPNASSEASYATYGARPQSPSHVCYGFQSQPGCVPRVRLEALRSPRLHHSEDDIFTSPDQSKFVEQLHSPRSAFF
ncbi:unnamed protein product, partial [Chrysoparadoxa australica]